jgi:hypothetical protein
MYFEIGFSNATSVTQKVYCWWGAAVSVSARQTHHPCQTHLVARQTHHPCQTHLVAPHALRDHKSPRGKQRHQPRHLELVGVPKGRQDEDNLPVRGTCFVQGSRDTVGLGVCDAEAGAIMLCAVHLTLARRTRAVRAGPTTREGGYVMTSWGCITNSSSIRWVRCRTPEPAQRQHPASP